MTRQTAKIADIMNKHQWQILGVGSVLTVLLMSRGTSRLHPPVPLPVTESSPGHYSARFTDSVTPMWVLAASLGMIMLTGTLLYRSRKNV